MTGDDDFEDIDRRSFIRAVGGSAATATAAATAGCQDVSTYEFTAAPVGLSASGAERLGFGVLDHETLVDERQREVGGQSVDVTVTSQAVVYSPSRERQGGDDLSDDWNDEDLASRSLGILSTPEASVLGRQLNPLATTTLSELVSGQRGRDLLRRTGVGGGEGFKYRRSPERVATRKTPSLLGEGAAIETYAGVAAGANGRDEAFLVHASRVSVDGDVVIVAAVQRRAVSDSFDGEPLVGDDGLMTTDDLSARIQFALDVPPYVTLDPPIDLVLPSVSVTDVRLVQKVEDTYVDGDGYEAPDPDLVAGENTAIVFDLEGANLDGLSGDVRFDLGWKSRGRSPVSETFYLGADEVRAIAEDRYVTPAVLHVNDTVEGGAPIPTFRLAADNEEVTLTVGAGGRVVDDTVVLREGSDYVVRTVPPLRVAFVEITDPDEGDNFGDGGGRASNYGASVDLAADYLSRVYPSDVSIWRFDAPVVAGGESDDFGSDLFDADSTIEGLVSLADFVGSGLLTGFGSFVRTPPGRSEAQELLHVLANSFDVVSAIVPGNYGGTTGTDFFRFHSRNLLGFAPWSSRFAVSTLEFSPGGASGMQADKFVETVAQETLHQLVGDGPYQGPAPDHPMAQRRGATAGGVNTTVGDDGVDYAHARDPVRSTAYDLEGGDFFVVEGFDYSSGTYVPDGPTTKTDADDVQSLMSYTSPDTWTDARLHQRLIDRAATDGASGGAAAGDDGADRTPVLAVSGRMVDGGFDFSVVRTYDGVPDAPGDETAKAGAVEVSFEGPRGEELFGRRIADHIAGTHGNGTEGAVSFVFPFPVATAFVRTEGKTGKTRLNPITESIRFAVGRVPKRGFREDARGVRKDVIAALGDVDGLMRQRDYATASAVLRKEVRPRLDGALREQYERALNQHSSRQVLMVVDEMVERLDGLTQMAG